MTGPRRLVKETAEVTVAGTTARVAAIRADGVLEPIVFLHGFGSVKEDYADLVHYAAFQQRPFIAYDAPGFGETRCDDPSAVSIPLLVETLEALLDHYRIGRFHLVGHSMGGLTALQFAHRHPHRVIGFVNIEGNLAPEDCFLSRQIIDHPSDDPRTFLDEFIDRIWHTPSYAHPGYAANLRHRVHPEAVQSIFTSMVTLTDNSDLLSKFLALPCPKTFMYGAANASLSYLTLLKRSGIELAEIPFSAHFPMYSNPPAMWQSLATTLNPPNP